MIRALGIFNARRTERGFEPIEIGIGLATGEVLAGSVGPTKRMEYTAIGANVNLAARLESANKYYGTVVLLAETTADALKSPAVLRRLDLIQVKGISRPTWVYEALGHYTAATFPQLASVINAYEAGLDCYQHATGRAGSAVSARRSNGPRRIGRPASSGIAAATIRPTRPATDGTVSGSWSRSSASWGRQARRPTPLTRALSPQAGRG